MNAKRLCAVGAILLTGFLDAGFAKEVPQKGAGGQPPKEKATQEPGKLKKYDDVITKDATTMPGLFAVHKVNDKIYFEIPQSALGRLVLWRAEVAKGPTGVSWGGMEIGHHTLRFEVRGNKVYLWKVAFGRRADGAAIKSAVEAASLDAIIAAFNVECEGKDRSLVIHVTSLFTTDHPDLSIKRAAGNASGV